MVAGQGDRHYVMEFDATGSCLLRDTAACTDCEDRRLRRVYDRGEFSHAEHPEIGNRTRPARVFRGLQLLRACALRSVLHLPRNAGDGLAFRVADDRCGSADGIATTGLAGPGGASPASVMTATTAPTFATSPTWTLIAERVPAKVAGTSIEVLSVSISKRLSPACTTSPAFLNHLVILPSATVSPSWGIRMSISCFSATTRRTRTDFRGTPLFPRAPLRAPSPIASCLRTRQPDQTPTRG